MADMIELVNPIERGVPFGYFAGGSVYRSETPPTLLVAAKTSAFIQSPVDAGTRILPLG